MPPSGQRFAASWGPCGATVQVMPARRGLLPQPWRYLTVGNQAKWPQGALWRDAPMAAYFTRAVARRLKAILKDDGWTVYRLAKEAGVSRQTIANILTGATWSDLPTIYRLEVALQQRLWINEDIP